MNDTLNVSEMFYSIDGEGKSMGRPVVFLRLQACNLLCNWKRDGKDYLCDTLEVWKTGRPYTFDEILNIWKKNEWLGRVLNGTARVNISGGEPTLQQKQIIEFCKLLRSYSFGTKDEIFIEMETNTSLDISPELVSQINLFNCSPKLSNSSMSKARRYNKKTLLIHSCNINDEKDENSEHESIFKFVVNNKDDIDEIFSDFLIPLEIERQRVWLMPEGATREELNDKRIQTIEWCKEYGFNYSDRLHIIAWNRKCGV